MRKYKSLKRKEESNFMSPKGRWGIDDTGKLRKKKTDGGIWGKTKKECVGIQQSSPTDQLFNEKFLGRGRGERCVQLPLSREDTGR